MKIGECIHRSKLPFRISWTQMTCSKCPHSLLNGCADIHGGCVGSNTGLPVFAETPAPSNAFELLEALNNQGVRLDGYHSLFMEGYQEPLHLSKIKAGIEPDSKFNRSLFEVLKNILFSKQSSVSIGKLRATVKYSRDNLIEVFLSVTYLEHGLYRELYVFYNNTLCAFKDRGHSFLEPKAYAGVELFMFQGEPDLQLYNGGTYSVYDDLDKYYGKVQGIEPHWFTNPYKKIYADGRFHETLHLVLNKDRCTEFALHDMVITFVNRLDSKKYEITNNKGKKFLCILGSCPNTGLERLLEIKPL